MGSRPNIMLLSNIDIDLVVRFDHEVHSILDDRKHLSGWHLGFQDDRLV